MPIFSGVSCPGPLRRPRTLAPYHKLVFVVFISGGKEYARGVAARDEYGIAMAKCIGGTDAAFNSVVMHRPIDNMARLSFGGANGRIVEQPAFLVNKTIGGDTFSKPKIRVGA